MKGLYWGRLREGYARRIYRGSPMAYTDHTGNSITRLILKLLPDPTTSMIAESRSRHGIEPPGSRGKKALLTVFKVRVNLPERLGATDVDLHIASGM